MKVYVLSAHRDHEEYPSSTEVIAVFADEKAAIARMFKESEKELAEWQKECDLSDIEITDKETSTSLFNLANNIEFTNFSVDEREVE